jgi:ectoine hydroxylase-related dioxygenase (phytanoyl-CoA dioxygenase family)
VLGRLLDQVIVDLRRDGVTVVEDVLSADEVGPLAEAVRALVEAEFGALMAEVERRAALGETRIDVWPVERGVVHLGFEVADDRFSVLVSHPAAGAVADKLLGPGVTVEGVSLRVPLPGFGHQGLHEDIAAPPEPATWLRLRATWVLTPFAVETGTLRYIPGSHLTGPPTEFGIGMPPHPDEVRVVAAPGAMVLKSSHVWHSGTFNASAEPRISMDVDYRACEVGPSAC